MDPHWGHVVRLGAVVAVDSVMDLVGRRSCGCSELVGARITGRVETCAEGIRTAPKLAREARLLR